MIPACRIPPPNILRNRLARAKNAFEPTSAEPTGAPSPLEKQTLTVSNGAAHRLSGDARRRRRVPKARPVQVQLKPMTPRHRRNLVNPAPSGQILPPPRLCVFSMQTNRERGKWESGGRKTDFDIGSR